jgi:hypothetical protein
MKNEIIDKYLTDASKKWKREKGIFKSGICDECKKKTNITWTYDPYIYQMSNKKTYKNLCQKCLDDLTSQI